MQENKHAAQIETMHNNKHNAIHNESNKHTQEKNNEQ